MKQKAQCATCASIVYFVTDRIGRVLERCPHCHDKWPLRAARPDPVTCEHGESAFCERCERKREAIRRGVAEHRARINRCKHGHDFTPENTKMRNQTRVCMTCYRDGIARKQARRNERRAHAA